MKYCSACGTHLEDSAAFCSNCGAKQGAAAAAQPAQQETVMDAITGSVSKLTGGKKEAVRPPLGKLFSQIFKSTARKRQKPFSPVAHLPRLPD